MVRALSGWWLPRCPVSQTHCALLCSGWGCLVGRCRDRSPAAVLWAAGGRSLLEGGAAEGCHPPTPRVHTGGRHGKSLPPAAVPRTTPTCGSPAPGCGRGLRPAGCTAAHSSRTAGVSRRRHQRLSGRRCARWPGPRPQSWRQAAQPARCPSQQPPLLFGLALRPPAHPPALCPPLQAKLREAAERRQAEERERLERERQERERFERQAAEARARAAEEAERQRNEAACVNMGAPVLLARVRCLSVWEDACLVAKAAVLPVSLCSELQNAALCRGAGSARSGRQSAAGALEAAAATGGVAAAAAAIAGVAGAAAATAATSGALAGSGAAAGSGGGAAARSGGAAARVAGRRRRRSSGGGATLQASARAGRRAARAGARAARPPASAASRQRARASPRRPRAAAARAAARASAGRRWKRRRARRRWRAWARRTRSEAGGLRPPTMLC